VLGGGSLFAIFAGLFFWWPKMFGVQLDVKSSLWSNPERRFCLCICPLSLWRFLGARRSAIAASP
jgi:cytochrome aa3-600 menaquinol oxidase subunit 1